MPSSGGLLQKTVPLSGCEQVRLARLRQAQRTPEEIQRRHEVLARTHGALSEENGEIFEQAMLDARRFELPKQAP